MMHIVDADIMIDLSRNHPRAVEFFRQQVYAEDVRLSSLTEMELVQGVRNRKELREMRVFLNQFERAEVQPEHVAKALEIQYDFFLSHGIGILDCVLAGMAVTNRWKLVSRNSKHYDFIPDLELVVPY